MISKVRSVFESFGYMPIHTPALEYAEILLGKYGEEGEKLLYKFQDAGGAHGGAPIRPDGASGPICGVASRAEVPVPPVPYRTGLAG